MDRSFSTLVKLTYDSVQTHSHPMTSKLHGPCPIWSLEEQQSGLHESLNGKRTIWAIQKFWTGKNSRLNSRRIQNRSLDNYLDKFLDLVMEAGYIDWWNSGKDWIHRSRTLWQPWPMADLQTPPLMIGTKWQKMLTKTAQPTKPSRYLSGHLYLPLSLLV